MLKIKVTEPDGRSIEYTNESLIDALAMGHSADCVVEVTDITAEVALADCIASRKAEYPSAEDFLNAFFDGGDAALDALRAQRLAIKTKYPKP